MLARKQRQPYSLGSLMARETDMTGSCNSDVSRKHMAVSTVRHVNAKAETALARPKAVCIFKK